VAEVDDSAWNAKRWHSRRASAVTAPGSRSARAEPTTIAEWDARARRAVLRVLWRETTVFPYERVGYDGHSAHRSPVGGVVTRAGTHLSTLFGASERSNRILEQQASELTWDEAPHRSQGKAATIVSLFPLDKQYDSDEILL
jgi:hypothetical protein